MKNKKYLFIASILSFILMAIPAQGSLVSESYYLDQNNAGLSPANYVQVTISDSTTNTGNIDFRVEVIGTSFPNPGDNFGMDKFFFNFANSLTVDENNIIDIDPDTWSIKEDKNAGGGFGKFELELKGNGNSRVTTLLFSITNVDNDSPKDYALGESEFFAAHIGDISDSDSGVDSAQVAGSTLVPIPGSVLLLSSGLIGLFFLRRKSLSSRRKAES